MQINSSPNISNFDFTALFDISIPVPKATVTDISTYIGSGDTNIIGIVIKIVDPTNLAFTTTVYPPNVDIYPGLTSFSINLPYYNGQVTWGQYKVYATLIDQDGTQYDWSDSGTGIGYKTINLCKPNSLSNAVNNYGGLNLDVDPNCDLGMLIVQDNGTGFTYNGITPSATETALTVTYPIDTTGTVSQQTATFIPFTFPLTIAGVYSIQGTVIQTYPLTDTTTVKAAYYYQNTFDVQCGYTLCKALCDYEKLVADVTSCSPVNPNQATQQLRTLVLVIAELGKIAWFKRCGKNFGDILERLRKIGGFQCNCDCAPQGISIAPLYMSGGTIVKGNMCGDIDLTLTQFMGNIKIDASDITYLVAASSLQDFITVTPTDGVCSKTFTISIDVCAMLATTTLSCIGDVNVSSPAIQDGDTLVWNEDANEWQTSESALPTLSWIDLVSTSGNWTVPVGSRLQYSKDFLGNVRLRGFISGISLNASTYYVLATLPSGYRPSTSSGEVFIVPATNGSLVTAPTPAMITILDTGQILLTLGITGSSSLSVNCEFNVH